MNHFEILDLDKVYDIDLALLRKRYLSKQALYHPDRAESDSVRAKNLDISMQLNTAYKILKDDYMRAEYLLKLLGKTFDDHALQGLLRQEDLEEIMEAHEKLDSIEELQGLKALKADKILKKTQIVQELTKHFQENNIEKALDITVRLKYLTNLVKNIDLKIKHADS